MRVPCDRATGLHYLWRAVKAAVLTGPGGAGDWHRRPYWHLALECGHSKEEWRRTGVDPPARVRCYECARRITEG